MNIQPYQAIIIYKIILKKLKIIIFYIELRYFNLIPLTNTKNIENVGKIKRILSNVKNEAIENTIFQNLALLAIILYSFDKIILQLLAVVVYISLAALTSNVLVIMAECQS